MKSFKEFLTEQNVDKVKVYFKNKNQMEDISKKLKGIIDYAVHNDYISFSKPKNQELVEFLKLKGIKNFNYDYALS